MTAFTDVQLSFVAHGVVGKLDHSVMRQDADLTQVRLLKIIEGNLPKHELAVYEAHLVRAKQRVALAQVKHRAEMTQLAPKAYTVLGLALDSFEKNPQLAYTAARDVLKDSDAPLHETRRDTPGTPLTQINIGMEAKGAKALDAAAKHSKSEEFRAQLRSSSVVR